MRARPWWRLFGEKDFAPVNKPEAVKMTDEQSTLMVEHRAQMGQLQRQYIIEEERSFTIIAFPIPEVGDSLKNFSGRLFGSTPWIIKNIRGSSRPSSMRWIRQTTVR